MDTGHREQQRQREFRSEEGNKEHLRMSTCSDTNGGPPVVAEVTDGPSVVSVEVPDVRTFAEFVF